MQLTSNLRTQMVQAIRTAINTSGKMVIQDSEGVAIVTLTLAPDCMTGISSGVGTFDVSSTYLKGVVPSTITTATANRWIVTTSADVTVMSGSCGDGNNQTNKDIIFNTLTWSAYDNITITGLSITVPEGTNDYLV